MKVTAIFRDGILDLVLVPETSAEQRMVGAVLGQPCSERAEIEHGMLSSVLEYDGHWSNKAVKRLTVTVKRPE